MTFVSHVILPSSTRIPRAAEVKAFELDAMPKRVFSSVFLPVVIEMTPYPFMWTTWSSFTTATAMPGTLKVSSVRLTSLSISSDFRGCDHVAMQTISIREMESVFFISEFD